MFACIKVLANTIYGCFMAPSHAYTCNFIYILQRKTLYFFVLFGNLCLDLCLTYMFMCIVIVMSAWLTVVYIGDRDGQQCQSWTQLVHTSLAVTEQFMNTQETYGALNLLHYHKMVYGIPCKTQVLHIISTSFFFFFICEIKYSCKSPLIHCQFLFFFFSFWRKLINCKLYPLNLTCFQFRP